MRQMVNGIEYLEIIQNKLAGFQNRTDNIPTESEFSIAAVLIPLAIQNGELVVLFTKRSANLKHHQGQISFPGGRMELCDRSLVDTALRETNEEIGIRPELVEILGSLAPTITPSGYYIYPYVGYLKDLEGLKKNLDEVEKIFCIPLGWLLEPENLYQEDYQPSQGEIHKVWFYKEYDQERVWGITAGIMHKLIEVIFEH